MKNKNSCLLLAFFSVFVLEFSETGKRDKRHLADGNSKPGVQLSGKEACVLLTTDDRTTGTH